MNDLAPFICPKCNGERPWIENCPVCDGAGVVWPPYPSDYDEDAMLVKPLRKCHLCGSLLGPFPHVCWKLK